MLSPSIEVRRVARFVYERFSGTDGALADAEALPRMRILWNTQDTNRRYAMERVRLKAREEVHLEVVVGHFSIAERVQKGGLVKL